MADISEIYDKVRRLLVALDFKTNLAGETGFMLPFEETYVVIDVHSLGEQEPIHPVEVWSPVLFDVPVTDALCRYLAGSKFIFGSFELYFDDGATIDTAATGTLVFSNTILGDYLDRDELETAIGMVITSATNDAEAMHSRFGGRRVNAD